MTIAVDFDGTIVEERYPEIGPERPFATETLRMLIRDQHRLILWTVREGELLEEAVRWCRERGVEFYAVNRDYPEEKQEWNEFFSRKIKADKSHLHHLFIEMGFSHVGTSLCVFTLNGLNVLMWLLAWQIGLDATGQFLVVVFVGTINTTGFYYIIRRLPPSHPVYRCFQWLASRSHVENYPFYKKMQRIIDQI